MQRQCHTIRQSSKQPLLLIEEAHIAIFQHQIVHYHSHKCQTISNLNTHLSLTDAEIQDQVLSFSNTDIAFRVIEKEHIIQIVKVNTDKVELSFAVQKNSTLVMARDLLRRKLCQVGFDQKFVKKKQLGKGATARVWLVQRRSDRKQFAAKIISIKESDNKSYETFINETRILRHLKNPNIVAIQSLYIAKKQLICVLEYLKGGTLLQELREDQIQTGRAKLKAIKDIAGGIQHLRQKRINIMVRINDDNSKTYVITDFGLACWIGQKELLYQKCGTPGYIAPEILRSGRNKIIVSHLSDMFSFGVICHFIMLLRSVFPHSSNPKELLLANKKANFSLNSRHYLGLLASEHDILRKTLEVDPQKRVSSEEFLKVWARDYERELNIFHKQAPKAAKSKKKQEEVQTKRMHSRGTSTQIIQKKPTSIGNKRMMRIKTEFNHQRDKREGSVSKFLNKVWNSITPSKTQSLRKKEEPSSRKLQMRHFLD